MSRKSFHVRFVSMAAAVLLLQAPIFHYAYKNYFFNDYTSGSFASQLQLAKVAELWETSESTLPILVPVKGHYLRPPPVNEWLVVRGEYNIAAKDGAVSNTGIPKVIHKVFLSTNEPLPNFEELPESDPLKRAHQSWTLRNPGYKMKYYDMDACRNYLRDNFHPVFLRAFDCIEAFAGKSNLFRAAVVYREGGFYSDWKQEALVDGILDIVQNSNENMASIHSPVSIVLAPAKGRVFARKRKPINPAFFGAIPGHPMLAVFLEKILMNVRDGFYGDVPQENTGPGVFGDAYKMFYESSNNVAVRREYPFWKLEYKWNEFKVDSHGGIVENGKILIIHKCDGCGRSGDLWAKTGGNDYRLMHKERTYYCSSHRDLFLGIGS